MSEAKFDKTFVEARRLAQALVDSMPLKEQVFRTGSLDHKEETCKYIRQCLDRLGFAQAALPADEYLYAKLPKSAAGIRGSPFVLSSRAARRSAAAMRLASSLRR